jgi:hypothetical protein
MAKVVDARDLKSLGGNPVRVRVPVPASSRLRAAILLIVVNAIGLIVFLQGHADELLSAVVDPLHPDRMGMERAFAGFAVYAVSLIAVLAIAVLLLARLVLRRAPNPGSWPRALTRAIPMAALIGALTALVVLAFIEVLLFKDYGIHLYEFDVAGILADAALRRDLGIQPVEVLRVVTAAITLLAAQLFLFAGAMRVARWRNGALARGSAAAMLVAVPGGLALFRASEKDILADRAEFEGALPLGRQLLLRSTSRPFIPIEPRLGAGGYPVLDSLAAAPVFARKSNVVFFVADGLRGDMFTPTLTPHLARFASRNDVITSARHFSTGHVSEAGIFGLTYALRGQAFHSFIEHRITPYPLAVLKRNGYRTFLLASSRLSPYPTDQLIRMFDDVAYPKNDDDAIVALARYLAERRADGQPYFILGFFYTPHYPFTSAKPHLRKYPMVGPKARTNYMNDVLQADDYFRQAFELVKDDYGNGRTVFVATSDHGEEIRDHGVFGHASATFWNEKVVVPFVMGLPGAVLSSEQRRPALTSHVDVWPTLFEHLGARPLPDAATYSDGRSLLQPPSASRQAVVTGRFFPHADRPSVLVEGSTKYWFRVSGVGASNRLCVVVTRVTDLADEPLSIDPATVDARMVPAFERFQAGFWRFIKPIAPPARAERHLC